MLIGASLLVSLSTSCWVVSCSSAQQRCYALYGTAVFLTLEPTSRHWRHLTQQLLSLDNYWTRPRMFSAPRTVLLPSWRRSLYRCPSTVTALLPGTPCLSPPLPHPQTRPTSATHMHSCATNRSLSRLRFHCVAIGRSCSAGFDYRWYLWGRRRCLAMQSWLAR